KSIYSAIMLSTFMWIIETYLSPVGITDNLVLVSFFGAALLALGTTIVFLNDASTGGTTIIAKILDKYFNIGVGKGLLIADGTVTLLAVMSFGVERGLFGFLSAIIIGNLVDKFIDGINPVRQVFIITKRSAEMVEFINKDIDRGCTILDGKGGYTKGEVTMIYTVLNPSQFITLKQYIKENDNEAFVTVNESTEVLGKGF
ncbi:MAG: YitT family protein, partial [Clostridium sp.]